MIQKTLRIFFLLTLAQTTLAQNKPDSLLRLLEKSKPDTSKVILLLRLADYYETNNQDSCAYYLNESNALITSLNYLKGSYLYHEQRAVLFFTKGDYTKSLEESKIGLVEARKLKNSSYVINMLNNIAIIYGYRGEFKSQLEYTLQVKKANEAANDSSKLSGIYHGLANCYLNLNQHRKGIEWAHLSIKLKVKYKKRNDYINRVYASLAQGYAALQMNDSALYFYTIAAKEAVQANDKFAESAIYSYMCEIYARTNQFSEMLKAAQRSLGLAKDLQSNQRLASSLYNVAYASMLNNNDQVARQSINEALQLATQDTLRDELKDSYMVLSYIAARNSDFVTLIRARQKTDSIHNAFLNEHIIKSTAEFEKKYETEKKDSQLKLQQAQLQRKNILNYILIAGAFILLFIFLLVYRAYKQKQKLQQQRISELEKEKQLTATEAVLKGEEQERTRLAKDLHDGLGGMLSGIKYSFTTMKSNLIMTPENQQAFERSIDMLDSSIKEMRRVAHNMMPEALVKFGLDVALKDFCNDISQSGALKVTYQSIGLDNSGLELTTAITIYRVIQELVNNAMKHARATRLLVQLSLHDNSLQVTVEDDGIGINQRNAAGERGMGWPNIQSRVKYLKGTVDVQGDPGNGTSVTITIPL